MMFRHLLGRTLSLEVARGAADPCSSTWRPDVNALGMGTSLPDLGDEATPSDRRHGTGTARRNEAFMVMQSADERGRERLDRAFC